MAAKKQQRKRARSTVVARTSAIKKSAEFFGFLPRRLHRIEIDWPKAAFIIGAGVRIDYASDKFDGKKRVYFHEFKPSSRVVIFAAEKPQPNGDNILIVKGKFRITDRGLIG